MKLPEDFWDRLRAHEITPTPNVLLTVVSRQEFFWFTGVPAEPDAYELHATYPCSTSKFGIGQQEGSNRTPLGLHAVREKIGDGCPADTVFKGRQPIGRIAEVENPRITTRILWLEGLEPGFNRGGDVNTHDRYVYIHGTGDESKIGEPDSHGCVHLRADDLIRLFDAVPSGTLVWIME